MNPKKTSLSIWLRAPQATSKQFTRYRPPCWSGTILPSLTRRIFSLLAMACSVLCISPERSAVAEMVFDNGATANTAYYSDAGFSGQKIYDNFTLSPTTSNEVNVATWSGLYATNVTTLDNFTIEFWDNGNNNRPGNLLNSLTANDLAREQVGTMFGRDVYQYTATFDAITFNPSETYWFSVLNNTNERWAWMADTTQGQLAFQTTTNGSVFVTQSNMDFALYSTPEPQSFVLFILFLAPAIRRCRRKIA